MGGSPASKAKATGEIVEFNLKHFKAVSMSTDSRLPQESMD